MCNRPHLYMCKEASSLCICILHWEEPYNILSVHLAQLSNHVPWYLPGAKWGQVRDNYDGVITHLEPNTQECEVRWALESITTNKASEGDGIPVVSNPERWCCESAALNMPANLENSAVATGLEKGSFQRKAMQKNAQTTAQLHSSHMLVKKCSKFSKPGFNSMWTVKLQMFKLDLEKAEEPEIRLPD